MKSRATTKTVVWNGGKAKTVIPADAQHHEVKLATGSVLWIRHDSGMISCLSAVEGNVEAAVVPDRAWAEVVSKYF